MKEFSPYKVIIIFISILFGCGCSFNQKYGSGNVKMELDTNITEWLKLNVDEALPVQGLNIWIPTNNLASSSLIRVPKYPRKFLKSELDGNPALYDFEINTIDDSSILRVSAIKNEQISLQIAVASRDDFVLTEAKIEQLTNERGYIIENTSIEERYVKYMPVQRARSEFIWSPKQERIVGEGVSGNMAPNVVGDPLMDMDTLKVNAYTAQPIWFTIKIPKDAIIGKYEGNITLRTEEFGEKQIPIELMLHDLLLPDPIDYVFNLDLWINPSAIAEHYKLEHWSNEHWKLIEVYLKDYASAGGKNIATTITHEPWHKPWIGDSTRSQIEFGYRSMVEWTKNRHGEWNFDYSVFDRYVELAEKVGLKGAINAYSLTPFHTRQKIPYTDESSGQKKILEVDINDGRYEEVWKAFLKDFKSHLKNKGWFTRTYLGFDEKPEAILQMIEGIIKDAAPEFLERIVIAGHPEATSLAQNLSISYMFFPGQDFEQKAVVPVLPTIAERNRNGKQTTFYLCAEPAHPNTLTFSPAVEARLIPWLALKYQTDGYLRWAYNNWTSDIFRNPVFLHTQGDDYYVYPGKKGPTSSIRWELLKEGIEDYELYKLRQRDGKMSNTDLERSIELATRNQDGRYKKTSDLIEAKQFLIKK